MRPGVRCRYAVQRIPDTGRQDLCLDVVLAIDADDIPYDTHPVLTYIIQAAYERTHVCRASLGAEQGLIYREAEGLVDLDSIGG